MRRKYTIARPVGNRTASASQVLWFFCNTLAAGPFPCIRRTMSGAHAALLSLDSAPCGYRLHPTLTVVAGAGGSASDLRQRGDRRLPPARPRGPELVHVHARENFFGSFGWPSPLSPPP
jgi:hypothetical protein